MSLGATPRQRDLFRSTTSFCAPLVADDSIHGLLHRECFSLFPDELFSDLFTDIGRRSVPPMVVAVVMVLQRLEGLSDREAVERFTFDARWKYAAGGLDFDYPGFVHTVLVDMRARLASSEQPDRIFDVVLDVGRQAGLVGRRRVLDSSPIYDAVATMDTVTLVRSAIRGVLAAAGKLEGALRARLRRDDDYTSPGKPVCDYEDRAAREALVDALAKDASALLLALEGRQLPAPLAQAAELLAAVVGQDLEVKDGRFRIARRVATDRVISTVDPDARHGHKTKARSFDGYKGHIAIDPDSELVTGTAVTAGNRGDGTAVAELLADELAAVDDAAAEATGGAERIEPADDEPRLTVYGDAAYGAGSVLEQLEQAGLGNHCKVQPPRAPAGHFTKDAFTIDLATGRVTCPAGHTAELRPDGNGRVAHFAPMCSSCPLAARCTTAKGGRSLHVGPHEAQLATARRQQTDLAWRADYRATRPKVERKLAHLLRRLHGGRHARVRGQPKVAADFALLAAAVNLARLAVLGVMGLADGWVLQPA
ncbi:MAG TPA: IS1182 family transposase [Chloroflexota bacterium]|nr:IS1182 family transposase [Chloroflexota bacterium]